MRDWTPSINPHDPQPVSESLSEYYKGRNEMDAGRLEQAVDHFKRSLAEDVHFKTSELLGECLLQLGRAAEALEPLTLSVAEGAAARPAYLLAKAHLDMGNTSAAKSAVEESLRRNRTYGPALELLRQIKP
ncbi:MAG TPA: tetratricopeptide repeat protein [Verrucomicrobiae bacterium]|nr:tetratricopeptide repeat protein [Verrucomicrobiae bacterium]